MTPTRTTPWMAFAPDISGVCSVAGTLLITSKPTSRLSTKTVMSANSSAHDGLSVQHGAAGGWTTCAVVGDDDAGLDLVGQVDGDARRRGSGAASSAHDVARVRGGGGRRHARRRGCRRRSTVTPPAVTDGRSRAPSRRRCRRVGSAARSTTTEPGRIAASASAVTSTRRPPARHLGGGDHHVEPGHRAASASCCARGLLGGELAGVPARRRPPRPSGSQVEHGGAGRRDLGPAASAARRSR